MEIKLRNPLNVWKNISFFGSLDNTFYYSNKYLYMWWSPTQNDNYVNLKHITIFNKNKNITLYLPNKIKYKNKIYNVQLSLGYRSFDDLNYHCFLIKFGNKIFEKKDNKKWVLKTC